MCIKKDPKVSSVENDLIVRNVNNWLNTIGLIRQFRKWLIIQYTRINGFPKFQKDSLKM